MKRKDKSSPFDETSWQVFMKGVIFEQSIKVCIFQERQKGWKDGGGNNIMGIEKPQEHEGVLCIQESAKSSQS